MMPSTGFVTRGDAETMLRHHLGICYDVCHGSVEYEDPVAALDRRYRVAFYSGVAGCVGFAALDASLIVGVLVVAGVASWVTAVAMALSSARIALCVRAAAAAQQNT